MTFDLRDFYHRQLHLIGVDSLKTSGAEAAHILDELSNGFASGVLTAPEVKGIPLTEAIVAYQQMFESTKGGASVPKMAIVG